MSPEQPMLPPAPRVRVVVDRADAPRCGIRTGDWVDVDGPGLSTRGRPFCPLALAAVLPVLGMRQNPLPADDWLVRKPWLTCPDARENVVLRLDVVPDGVSPDDLAEAAGDGAPAAPGGSRGAAT
ncbi:TIGR04076 family protein [Streptomyces sp. NPDC047000]|uniref:TIGR04076 family protein n=1 Tax=Streptomyces sp. NPDC047000 TaxID=3155474 RepID=UPI0033DBC8E2